MTDNRFYELISHLWRGGSYSYYWTPDTDEGKLSFWFPVVKPKEISPLWQRINIYFSVHPVRFQGGMRARAKLEDIEAVNCLFAEFDIADGQTKTHLLDSINQLDTPPSVIVFSGGGYHCYWLLEQTYHIDSDEARQRIIDIQYSWVDFVGGDQAAKDIARVLRVPGSCNRKPEYAPNYPQVEIVKFDLNLLYSLDDFTVQTELLIQQIRQRRADVIDADVIPVDLDDQTILEKMQQKDAAALALWGGDISAYSNDHSDADLALCSKLAFWFGRDRERIDRVFRRSGLYRPKWLRDDYRQRTIDRAIASCTNTYTPPNGNLGNPQDLIKPAAHANGNVAHSTGATQAQTQGGSTANSAPSIDRLMLTYSADDSGNARSAFLLYGTVFAFCDTHGYLHYNGRHWTTEGAQAAVVKAVEDTLIRRRLVAVQNSEEQIIKASKPSASNIQNCLYIFKSMIDTEIDNFDSNPDLLNCKNGVVDLRTGDLRPHDPSQKFTYCIAVNFDLQADYTDWVNFLQDTVDGPGMTQYLKLAVGYTATGRTSEECMFYVHGPTRSGKGTFAETVLSILCKPLGIQADFSTFTAKREGDTQNFDLAPLKPARFVVASESNKYDTLNEAKVKTVTGGDWIRCAFKRRDHFEYRPQFKVWLVSNHSVKGDVEDDAFWGRVKLIQFPHSRLGKEDKSLKRKMRSEDNLRGVLRWIVEGAIEWYRNPQGLVTPPCVSQAIDERRQELDYIQQWLDTCCAIIPTGWVTNSALYYSYKSWCEGIGQRPKGLESLTQTLAKKGFKIGVQRRINNGQRSRGVEGISIV